MAHHGIAPIRIDAPFISVAAVFVEWFGFLKIKIIGVRFSEHNVNSCSRINLPCWGASQHRKIEKESVTVISWPRDDRYKRDKQTWKMETDVTKMESYKIAPALQPDPGTCAFELDATLSSMVALQTKVPDNAYTVQALGAERAGHGVVISDTGLVLTIGYLIVEAESIWMVDHTGQAVAGHVAGYDQETGFGLVQALGRINAPALPIGSAHDVNVGDSVIFAGHGGRTNSLSAVVAEKREFAGYWEYLLDEALFTEPPHPFWGGGALIDTDGRLCGIGSLFVQMNPDEIGSFDGNMTVPIDILKPIMDDMTRFGKPQRPARPWIGALSTEAKDQVIVVNTWDGGPADKAGLQAGDLVIGVGGEPVASLAQFYRCMWALGAAGVEVPLDIVRAGRIAAISIQSADRDAYHLAPKLH